MNRHRIITRTSWHGNQLVTQRFRVKTGPLPLVRFRVASAPEQTRVRWWADVLMLGLAISLWFAACFILTLEWLR